MHSTSVPVGSEHVRNSNAGVGAAAGAPWPEQQPPILNEDLSGRTFDRPLRPLEGEFNPHVLHRRRLFVARKKNDETIEAFLACSPVRGGRSWAFETYRKKQNSTRGVTTYLFRSAMDQLRSEGVEQISLCLIPGRNVKNSSVLGGDWRMGGFVFCWDRIEFDFLCFRPGGQTHGMPGSSGPGIV